MNLKMFIGVVVAALALTVAELSCVTYDDAVFRSGVSFPTEAAEHDPAFDADVSASTTSILAR